MPEPDPWPAEPAPGATLRCGTRVVVVDEDERVLLFRSFSDEGEPFWICPGGGIEDGETPEDGARRELREETGLTGPPAGPLVLGP
jgi:ADP-ribose pyrophosphatase YjhB (NUDIX family)